MEVDQSPLKFAVIGCGMLARSQHLPNIVRSKRMSLEVCCDTSEAVLGECRSRFAPTRTTTDYRDAIEDPRVQVVCIATTERFRLPLIEIAAAAGKPVYVEKPLARELEEMLEIRRVVKRAGIPFCIGHNRRSSPAMRDARRIFRQHMERPNANPWRWRRNDPGTPHLAEDGTPSFVVRINDDWHSWKGWVFDKQQAPHGAMLFEMTHFTDLCNWFLADEPVEVFAMESGQTNHAIIIRYRGGALATISMCSNGTLGYAKELYEAIGNGGIVVVDHMLEVRSAGIADAPPRLIYPMLGDKHPEHGREGGLSGWLAKKRAAAAEAISLGDPMRQFTAEPDKGHAHALEFFCDEILGKGPVVCDIDAAVSASVLSFAAIESARRNTPVAVNSFEQP